GLHLSSTHTLFTHLLLALGKLHCGQVQPPFLQVNPIGQTTPHAPQLLASTPEFTSQPFADLPSQSRKSPLHLEMKHCAFWQATIALGKPRQGAPHEPQFLKSLSTLVSQPSLASLLQSSKPNWQAEM